MINFKLLHPKMTQEYLGFVPLFMDLSDHRPAKEQIHANYQHGGGWHPIGKFKLTNPPGHLDSYLSPYSVAKTLVLKYPGDPPLQPLAVAQLRDETIVLYDGAFLAIFQPDYSFEISRVD